MTAGETESAASTDDDARSAFVYQKALRGLLQQQVKRRYDPTNLFRLNQNVTPGS